MGLYLHNGWATLFITLLTKHVITLKFVLNGKVDFVANFTHFPCTCIHLQVLQGEKYLGVECCVILVSLHE